MKMLEKHEQKAIEKWISMFGTIACLSEEVDGIVRDNNDNIEGVKHALIKGYAKLNLMKMKDVKWDDVFNYVKYGFMSVTYLDNALSTVRSEIDANEEYGEEE